jgi:hypothetical protein
MATEGEVAFGSVPGGNQSPRVSARDGTRGRVWEMMRRWAPVAAAKDVLICLIRPQKFGEGRIRMMLVYREGRRQ